MCGNNLCEITLLTVQKMNRLVYLVFVDNIIERLGVDLLWGLVNWKYFYFTKNKLQAVHPDVFLGFPKF
jgi:hypothetical protein